ncbi:hypothetical protein [Nonomuraea turcica]|uniref:hypothetical protein n=1 Tax=Nonomuraea sp. G32 TaxID=3067274 RepID=UPI00273B6F7F|nr:hypothetical protein [Nonomuraea sp. G32]MDP4512079.1 hypothetical protein [Nonomuraea sp. G32]
MIGHNNQEACVMQSAETVLGVLRERGRKSLPCDELYRQMFNKNLYLMAYGRIYANDGAMTPGASAETADGMSEDKIGKIVESDAPRTVSLRPGPADVHPEKGRETQAAGTADLVGQARR